MNRGRFLGVLAAAGLAGCAKPPAAPPSDRFAEIYRELHPSVVFLKMKAPSGDPKRHGELDDAYGSAFIVASGPWGSRIVTAKHVIDDAHGLHALVGDASRATDLTVLARDETHDLALLQTAQIKDARPATLGESGGIVPGEPIGVLGYPIPDAFEDEGLGTTASLYAGHVASIRKDAIELDLAIIPGESGGPVFSAATGKVIGLAESRFEEEHAIGFATPIDVVKAFLSASGH